jgi:hypothetical protein
VVEIHRGMAARKAAKNTLTTFIRNSINFFLGVSLFLNSPVMNRVPHATFPNKRPVITEIFISTRIRAQWMVINTSGNSVKSFSTNVTRAIVFFLQGKLLYVGGLPVL